MSGDPLLVAQQIKNCIRDSDWTWLLRRALYNEHGNLLSDNSSPLIAILCKLCANKKLKIKSVVNYNYDDCFEMGLKKSQVKYKPIFSESYKPQTDILPIYHPHGFLPLNGGPDNTQFVLAESDYHQHVAEPHSWFNLIQLQSFTTSTCVFIGTSMKDPALRRLLRIGQSTTRIPHYAFLPVSTPITKRSKMFDSLFDKDATGLGVRVIRYNPLHDGQNTHNRLVELLVLLSCSIDMQY